jgi:hypothetical protein
MVTYLSICRFLLWDALCDEDGLKSSVQSLLSQSLVGLITILHCTIWDKGPCIYNPQGQGDSVVPWGMAMIHEHMFWGAELTWQFDKGCNVVSELLCTTSMKAAATWGINVANCLSHNTVYFTVAIHWCIKVKFEDKLWCVYALLEVRISVHIFNWEVSCLLWVALQFIGSSQLIVLYYVWCIRGCDWRRFCSWADNGLLYISEIWQYVNDKQKTSVALSPRANYTDWATATCRRNLVPTFVDIRVLRGQRGGTPMVVNFSFLDRSRYISFK